MYPPGVYPQRQYQLDVVADAVAQVCFGDATVRQAGRRAVASATSVRRWTAWAAALATPAALLAVAVTIDPDSPAGAGLSVPSSLTPIRKRAAQVLGALEHLALALVRRGLGAAAHVRTGLARVLLWQHASHGDVVSLTVAPCHLSPPMVTGNRRQVE